MTESENKAIRRVLTIGPSLKTLGGMSSVIAAYRDILPGFRHLASNSIHGTVAGAFNAAAALVRMPFERLLGRSILHIHSASGKSFARKSVFIRWGHLLGYKVIFHCHGGASRQYFESIGIGRTKKILSKASAIIALSESWKEYFQTTFGFNNITVISNPVYIPENAVMPQLDGTLNLLFLGYISDNKGIFEALEAFGRNRDRWNGRVHLRIGGNGEIDRLHSEIERLGIADMVDFIGWTKGEAKEEAFAKSHIVILPSHNEGLPLSVLEGMAHGKPVIATAVGGIPEIVENGINGILISPGDTEAFAAAVDFYLREPDNISRHGLESRRRVAPFSLEASFEKLAGLYQTLI